jgi:formate dehydrogenase iron-sulfur subunit
LLLLLDEPEVYWLPLDPVVTTRDLPGKWRHVATAARAPLLGAMVSRARCYASRAASNFYCCMCQR